MRSTVAALLWKFCQDQDVAAVPQEHHMVTTKESSLMVLAQGQEERAKPRGQRASVSPFPSLGPISHLQRGQLCGRRWAPAQGF